MKVLKGILSESREYYLEAREKVIKRLAELPKGSIKERLIRGKKYFYLQQRRDKKIIHKYLGKNKPHDLIDKIKERAVLKKELKSINESLKILSRAEGRKHVRHHLKNS